MYTAHVPASRSRTVRKITTRGRFPTTRSNRFRTGRDTGIGFNVNLRSCLILTGSQLLNIDPVGGYKSPATNRRQSTQQKTDRADKYVNLLTRHEQYHESTGAPHALRATAGVAHRNLARASSFPISMRQQGTIQKKPGPVLAFHPTSTYGRDMTESALITKNQDAQGQRHIWPFNRIVPNTGRNVSLSRHHKRGVP